jgi:hypothetical protein
MSSRDDHPSNNTATDDRSPNDNAEGSSNNGTYINITVHNHPRDDVAFYDGRPYDNCADDELDLFYDVIDGLYKHNPEAFIQYILEHVVIPDGYGRIIYRKFGADVSGTDPRDRYTD